MMGSDEFIGLEGKCYTDGKKMTGSMGCRSLGDKRIVSLGVLERVKWKY